MKGGVSLLYKVSREKRIMSINHGADLFSLSNKLGFEEKDLLDFSSNINPFGSSPKAKKAIINNIDMVSMYPDPMYHTLKESISKYCNCNKENILLGAGATELISSFINIVSPKTALLISPAYSEYEKELKKTNCSIIKYFSKEENDFKIDINDVIKTALENSVDLIVICNPNNPTGFAFTNTEIELLLKKSNSYIMVDETYVEFADKNLFSQTSLVDKWNKLFVIRGTSKFFSTPGIRLGYALNSDKIIKDKIINKIDIWNVNIIASRMGEIMFLDQDYIDSTLSKIKSGREYLLQSLKEFKNLKVYNSMGNFILCKLVHTNLTSKDLYQKLILQKIIIRNCESFEGLSDKFFRVCVLKPDQNEFLIDELSKIIN